MKTEAGLNHEVILAAHPTGALRAEDFAIVTRPLAAPGPGQVRVRNRWFRISISTRLMADPTAEAVTGIPFPPLRIGDTLADGAIGEVVECGPDTALTVGELVMHPLGWREQALVTAADYTPLGPGPVDPVAWLGHGWTAYAALTVGTRLQPGETVLVTSGAGAIGAMAGQIAALLGAGRVIGSTSSEAKAQWMREVLGYDATVIRGEGPFRDGLARVAGEGIDVIIDMVGGEQLQAALELARPGARCVLLGALTAELDPGSASLQAPVCLDSFQIILKGLSLRGFSACEQAPEAFDAWFGQLARWQAQGKLRLAHSLVHGLAQAPVALAQACAGELRGVVLVALDES